jgi:hypothetical protein
MIIIWYTLESGDLEIGLLPERFHWPYIYRLVQVSKTWLTHGRPLGLRMAPHGHKVKTNTSSKFTAPSTNSSTAHMNHDWFSSESRYLARYLDALATGCSIVVGWCICPETLWYVCLPLFVVYVVGIQLCLVALALYALCCITCAASGILSRPCRRGQFHHHQRSGSSSWGASQHVYEEATVPSEKKRIS